MKTVEKGSFLQSLVTQKKQKGAKKFMDQTLGFNH